MEDCKFCKVDELGDPTDDHEDLIRKKVASIGSTPLFAGVHIISGRLWWYLCGDYVDYPSPSVKIRYCPMCGKALNEKKAGPRAKRSGQK